MTRRYRFLETTVYIDCFLKVRIDDTERGSLTTVQPVRIPALLAWLMVQVWLWSRRWAKVKVQGSRFRVQGSELIRWAVALPAVALLGVARWQSNTLLYL